jgi:hypothetical protein
MSDSPDSLVLFPAVLFLSAAIPIGDHVVHVAHEYRVMRKGEELGLFAQLVFATLPLDVLRLQGNVLF